jgi:NADH:ubiquinone oxidoreductase subunit F (NADH-binding)
VTTLSVPTSAGAVRPGPSSGLPRLIPSPSVTSLGAHLAHFGPLPPSLADDPDGLVARVGEAGLRGRGGAGFPTGTKLAAVARSAGRRSLLARRSPIVVANGTEGEPASVKDVTLLRHAPHLVLDGVVAAAAAVGAVEGVVCVDRRRPGVVAALERALAERTGHDHVPIRVAAAPSHYVTGEESALVHWLNGGEARPTAVPPRPFERGVAGRPTLVDNVETLAHLALIARFGPAWWRGVGTPDEPGSLLVTITDGRRSPAVFETTYGYRLADLLAHAGVNGRSPALVGGYFGSWLRADDVETVRLTTADLGRCGASIGCGAVATLPDTACPLREVARVTTWLASQSAGQCGPCVHGLPAVARAVQALVEGDRSRRADAELRRLIPMVSGRGGCKMPDGALRFVASALQVFDEHIGAHRHGPCGLLDAPPLLPVPRSDRSWR